MLLLLKEDFQKTFIIKSFIIKTDSWIIDLPGFEPEDIKVGKWWLDKKDQPGINSSRWCGQQVKAYYWEDTQVYGRNKFQTISRAPAGAIGEERDHRCSSMRGESVGTY